MEARRFVQYARRVSAYGGVMTARLDAQRETTGPQARPGPRDASEMDLAEFTATHPGLISVTRAAE